MIRKRKQAPPSSSQSGFTIIEALLGIIVAGVLMTATAPVIVISVATRLQAKRVEQATQVARSYIDEVRSNPDIAAPATTVFLDQSKQNPAGNYLFQGVAQPPNPPTAASLTTLPGSLIRCVDIDGGGCSADSARDVVIQAFRSTTIDPTTTPTPAEVDADKRKGYILGVRIYRADGFDGGAPLQTKEAGDRQSATFTGGFGAPKAPLVEMITEIAGAASNRSNLCDRYGCI